jgi:N-acetyltransferase 10
MGYGSRALQALDLFYRGEYYDYEDMGTTSGSNTHEETEFSTSQSLMNDEVAPRSISSLPPLLQNLSSLKPPSLDYIGVSYGLTSPLLRFWKKAKYMPLYIRQTKNDLTGECTCVMVKSLADGTEGFQEFATDFRRRFLSLLSFGFRDFPSAMALSLLQALDNNSGIGSAPGV